MIFVRRGKETTEVNLEGGLGTLMVETILVVESIRECIIEKVDDNPAEAIFLFVNELIDAAYGKR